MYPARFAAVYDRLMDDFDYPAWARYYLALLRQTGCAPKTACECGCGTGSMTVELARAGLKMTGIDVSEGMLQMAADKARSSGLFIPFVKQDMCALDLHRPVDAVLCPCDGVNYLLDGERLRAFFARAFCCIRPGGAIAFDVSTPYKLFGMTAPFYEDRADLTYFWVSEREGPIVRMALTFFARKGGGLYERFDEEQVQRAHTARELTAALADAGFQGASVHGDRVMEAPAPDAQRWHITAVRP